MAAPWSNRKSLLGTANKMERLSKEIIDFEFYIRPTKREQVNRDTLLYSVTQIVNMLHRDASLKPFGSYETGLQFPSSDIDICVTFEYELRKKQIINSLYRLKNAFLNRDIFNKRDIQVIGRPRIPLLTATDENKVSIDISMQSRPLSSTRTVLWLKEYPELKPLFMVLKLALTGFRLASEPNLDPISAKHCGLASYSLICMIVSFLQMQTENIDKTKPDYYAQLLLHFLLFYSNFDQNTCVISLKDGGEYYTPDNIPRSYRFSEDMLNIIDPDMPEMNVARSTSKFNSIKRIFRYMYEYLNEQINSDKEESVLSAIIQMPTYAQKEGQRPEGSDFAVERIYAGPNCPSSKRRRENKPTSGILHEAGEPHHVHSKKKDRNRPSPYSRPSHNQRTYDEYDDDLLGNGQGSSKNNNKYDNSRKNNYYREYERHKSNGRSHLAQHYKQKANRYP